MGDGRGGVGSAGGEADSIIPGAGNPMAWDRYGYALNSPVSNVDPSGHRTCTAQQAATGDETCDQNIKVDPENFTPMPDPLSVPSKECLCVISEGTRALTLQIYDELRRHLVLKYGGMYVDDTGKILDKVILAFIIAGEFGGFKFEDTSLEQTAFKEGLEALSNQYADADFSSSYCGSDGCSMTEQLTMLFTVESFRSSSFDHLENESWQKYLRDARAAIEGYSNGSDKSWMWGNVTTADLSKYNVVVKVETNIYPGRDYFIVHSGRKY